MSVLLYFYLKLARMILYGLELPKFSYTWIIDKIEWSPFYKVYAKARGIQTFCEIQLHDAAKPCSRNQIANKSLLWKGEGVLYSHPGTAPGCLRGGGGGGNALLSTAPPLKKSLRGGGGLQHIWVYIYHHRTSLSWQAKNKCNCPTPYMVSQIRYITIPSLLPLLPQYSYLKTKTKINFLIHKQYFSPRISNKSLYTVRGGFPTPCRKIFG